MSAFCKTQKVINNKVVSDNRKFWQKISLFSEKALPKETIILKADSRTIMINHELAETFNIFYSNITQHIKIDRNLLEITQDLKTTPKYHQNKRECESKNKSFSFSFVTK